MDSLRAGRLLRAWLPVCNIVALALVATASLVYLVRMEIAGGIRPAPAMRQARVAHEPAPLPRPRPDEPAFTGSLRPKRPVDTRPAAEPIDDDYSVAPPADTLAVFLGDTDAVLACEGKVRDGLPFPNSLTRLLETTDTRHVPGAGSLVSFDFDAVNGLGFPLRMHAECALDGSRIARLDVTPRWDAASADQSVFSIPPSTK